MEPVCYLDLDGVLVDFVGGALALHGKHIPPGEVGWDFPTQVGLSGNEFWAPLGYDFWAGLGWMPEGKELLAGVEKLFGPRVVLLSSPCDTEGCAEGKRAWVKRELPHLKRNLVLGQAKELLAAPGKILVDDHEGNVDKFVHSACGGRAVLVPRSWNCRRGETKLGGFEVSPLLAELETAQLYARMDCDGR